MKLYSLLHGYSSGSGNSELPVYFLKRNKDIPSKIGKR
jgi:hypothetical protein